MKYKELSQKTPEQLKKELVELQEKANGIRQKQKLGQVKNVRERAQVRKDIARIHTYLRAN